MTLSNPIEIDDAIVLLLGAGVGAGQRAQIKGITRLEKLIFLLERETNSSKWLNDTADFEAYNFGPFSRKVYKAVETLSAAEIITDSSQLSSNDMDTWEARAAIDEAADGGNPYTTRKFELTERGWRYFNALKSEVGTENLEELSSFKGQFARLPLRQLVRYVYQRYEQFTTKSLIRDQVLGTDG